LLCINIYKIYNCEPSLVIQSLTGLVSILYIPFFYAYTTKKEFAFAGAILLLAIIGVILFIKSIDIPFIDNTILGHHEIFHLLLAIVGLVGYFMLHSIIYRRCNGIGCE
jgi:FtsH-binding integral membrane protein